MCELTSRKHIPRACREQFIPCLSECQSIYEAFKKQYSTNPFSNTTIEAGTRRIDGNMEEKKQWKKSLHRLIGHITVARHGNYQEPLQSPHHFNTSMSGQLEVQWTKIRHFQTNLSLSAFNQFAYHLPINGQGTMSSKLRVL